MTLLARLRAGWPADRSPVSRAPLQRGDVALAIGIAVLAAAATFFASGLLDRRLLETETMDVWFEADFPRIVRIATDRYSVNDGAKFHPLFALVIFPAVYVQRALLGLDPWVALRVVYAVAAGVWGASIFSFLRLIGQRREDAIVFTLLGATSATAMFWFPMPETHTMASSSVLLAMLVVAVSAHRVVPVLIEVAASAATLGVTLTNWMAGVLATALRHSVRKTVLICAGALALVVALWSLEKRFVPQTAFFVGGSVGGSHILSPESRGVLHVAEVFFVHSVVMPEITVADRPGAGKWPVMLIQPADPGSAGVLSAISAVLWGALLLAGVWALVRLRGRERLRIYLALLLAGQFVLFVLFGNETFLYAPNFFPALLGVAALAALTPARKIVLGVTAALVITNSLGNAAQLRRANAFFETFAPYRHDYTEAKAARPNGPWSSGSAGKPIELALPGTRKFDRGISLAGGGLSPGLDQFTMSLWVLNDSGSVVATSDNLPREESTPIVARDADSTVMEVGASTRYYRAIWRATGPRRYRLELMVLPQQHVALVVRGMGPMRAPVRQLAWDGDRLLVNRRWTVDPTSSAVSAYLVNENDPLWATARPERSRIAVIDGWGAARLELLEEGTHRFEVYDTDPFGPIDRALATLPRSPGAAEPWDPVPAVAAAAGERAGAADGKDAALGAATDDVER